MRIEGNYALALCCDRHLWLGGKVQQLERWQGVCCGSARETLGIEVNNLSTRRELETEGGVANAVFVAPGGASFTRRLRGYNVAAALIGIQFRRSSKKSTCGEAA